MGDLLGTLDVLVLDCQATGAFSGGGHLLEIGWLLTRAAVVGGRFEVGSHLLRPPPGAEIAPRILRLTGIPRDDLEAAAQPLQTWRRLCAAAGHAAALPPGGFPTVIHYSRFEEPFLRHLHSLTDPGLPFPLRIICTHEIVRRLLPQLPRCGLRAVAGYFGHGLAAERRCGPHVAATALIWSRCVAMLAADHGVDTLAALERWCKSGRSPTHAERCYPLPRSQRAGLPEGPGVYRMRRSGNDLLYIGKAANLRQRVGSYFHRGRRHPEHILEMLTQARRLEVTETDSALEAALLESDEIKTLAPPYNRALKNSGRRPVFCTRDFSRRSDSADGLFRLGPLPAAAAAALAGAAGMIAARGGGPHALNADHKEALFGFSRGGVPADDCLWPGMGLFWERHREAFCARTAAQGMLVLGARLWRQRRAAATESCDDARDDGELDAGQAAAGPAQWTPEGVAGILESVICHGAALVRRARWLVMLSESVVCWERHGADGVCVCLRELMFTSGAVASRATRPPGSETGIPEGWARGVHRRRQHFDAATYDRLRILTTELRRLVCQGRNPRVCLGPGRVVGPERLARGLAWI